MGWISDVEGLETHEGYAAYVTADEQVAGSSNRDGVFIHRGDQALGRGADAAEPAEFVPWSGVVAWQTRCACGWAGGRWDRAATLPGEYGGHDADDAFLPDGTSVETVARKDWEAHLEPLGRLSAVRAVAEELARARDRLDRLVAEARSGPAPASWTDIGRATGMSRQSAHERWRDDQPS